MTFHPALFSGSSAHSVHQSINQWSSQTQALCLYVSINYTDQLATELSFVQGKGYAQG